MMEFKSIGEIESYTNSNPSLNMDFFGDVMKARTSKKVSHADLTEMYSRKWKPRLEVKLRRWMEGNLFYGQKASFDMWIGQNEISMESDRQEWNDLVGMLEGIGQELPEGLFDFHALRITGRSRKQILEQGGEILEGMRNKWRQENNRHKWDWQ